VIVAGKTVVIDYTNWRGDRREREIRPLSSGLQFTKNQWHPDPQWLLQAVDVESGSVRTFAMRNIHSWREV
jgi:predicted DNA-binding transcriptional regulator YafY